MNLIKTSFYTSLSTAVSFITGFIITKVVAVKIGPKGMAYLGQFQNTTAILTMLATGAIATGVIKYLAEWVNTFITRYNRWASPKYLIGESYGTTRVSGLALELQNSHWMYLNGVILVSPTELGIKREGPVDAALMLPYSFFLLRIFRMINPVTTIASNPTLIHKDFSSA